MLRATRRLTLTRRRLLQNSAWIAAATMFPRLAAAVVHDVSPVMEKLSSYMAEARNRALPNNVERQTKHHILDTIAAMVSGSELPPGRMAIQFARSYGGEKIATVVASQILCGPIEAVARERKLSPKYLGLLWTTLNGSDPSPLIDDVRARWKAARPADALAIAEEIARWQA